MPVSNTPLLDLLPAKGWKDNPVAAYVTAPTDSKVSLWTTQAEEFYKIFDPALCPEGYLDYVAYLYGFSGPYWEPSWSPTQKRAFLSNAIYLWNNRGTKGALEKAIECLGYEISLKTPGLTKLPFKLPGKLKENNGKVRILLGFQYSRDGKEFAQARKLAANYAPANLDNKVAYRRFRLGRSKLGDPLYS